MSRDKPTSPGRFDGLEPGAERDERREGDANEDLTRREKKKKLGLRVGIHFFSFVGLNVCAFTKKQ